MNNPVITRFKKDTDCNSHEDFILRSRQQFLDHVDSLNINQPISNIPIVEIQGSRLRMAGKADALKLMAINFIEKHA